jgi:hypothetical protein
MGSSTAGPVSTTRTTDAKSETSAATRGQPPGSSFTAAAVPTTYTRAKVPVVTSRVASVRPPNAATTTVVARPPRATTDSACRGVLEPARTSAASQAGMAPVSESAAPRREAPAK